MKQLSSLLILIFCFCVGCEKERETSIQPLVGEWKLVAYEERQENGMMVWKDLEEYSQGTMTFRSDGVLLDSRGKTLCCAPGAYYLNGGRIEYVHSNEADTAPICLNVLCNVCEAWYLDLKDDELMVRPCSTSGVRYRYIRQ